MSHTKVVMIRLQDTPPPKNVVCHHFKKGVIVLERSAKYFSNDIQIGEDSQPRSTARNSSANYVLKVFF